MLAGQKGSRVYGLEVGGLGFIEFRCLSCFFVVCGGDATTPDARAGQTPLIRQRLLFGGGGIGFSGKEVFSTRGRIIVRGRDYICRCFAYWCVFAHQVRLFCLLVCLRILYDLCTQLVRLGLLCAVVLPILVRLRALYDPNMQLCCLLVRLRLLFAAVLASCLAFLVRLRLLYVRYAVALHIGASSLTMCGCFACWCVFALCICFAYWRVFAYYVLLLCLLARLQVLYDLYGLYASVLLRGASSLTI